MFTIRNAQLKIFQQSKWIAFHKEARQYLMQAVPHLEARFERAEIDTIIQQGIEKTGHYQNVNSEKDILKFIELMVRYGIDFDRDETLPFVDRIVQERQVHEREPHIEALYELKGRVPLADRATERGDHGRNRLP